jgi:hypothetical protein
MRRHGAWNTDDGIWFQDWNQKSDCTELIQNREKSNQSQNDTDIEQTSTLKVFCSRDGIPLLNKQPDRSDRVEATETAHWSILPTSSRGSLIDHTGSPILWRGHKPQNERAAAMLTTP